MIVVRTNVFGEREQALMLRLQQTGIHNVAVAVDETKGSIDVSPFAKVSVTRESYRQLGLYCTDDFTWRNGDYVLYLARQQFPKEKYFWMIEPDVEHSFVSDAELFARFDSQTDADLLAPYLHESTKNWWWRQTARPRSTGVRRSLFCIIRLSAQAIDLCLRERRKRRFSIRDRLCWPNDEAFVATEIVYAGLPAADFNDFRTPVYTSETLGFDTPIDGTDGTFRSQPNMIYHPVLFGSAYRERIDRISRAQRSNSSWNKRRKLQRMLSALLYPQT